MLHAAKGKVIYIVQPRVHINTFKEDLFHVCHDITQDSLLA